MSEKAKASANTDKVTPSEKLEAARQKVVEVASGVRDGAGRAGSSIRDGAGRASEAAKEKYAVAKENVRQGYDRVTKDLDHLSQDVNEYVRHNPGKSVLIAAVAGFLLGALIRGRKG